MPASKESWTEQATPSSSSVHRAISTDNSELEGTLPFTVQVPPIKAPEDAPSQQAVDFESPQDPSNPVNWSKSYKWAIVALLSTVNIIA